MTYRPVRDLSIEEIGRFRSDYLDGKDVDDIAAGLGISIPACYLLIRGLGLKLRTDIAREAKAVAILADAGIPIDQIEAGVSLPNVGRVLERRTVEQLLLLQRRAAAAPAGIKGEILAKAIAHQTRALKSIREWTATLTEDEPSHDEPPARDLGELRDELRRHLERICAEQGGDRELRGGPQPS